MQRVIFISALLLGTRAFAAVAALPPEVVPQGAIQQEALDKLHEAVVRGLESGGFEVLAPSTVQQSHCTSPACAKALGASHVVSTQVEVIGKNYDIRCQLLGTDGQVAGESKGSCEVCTFAEAQGTVANAAKKLATSYHALSPASMPSLSASSAQASSVPQSTPSWQSSVHAAVRRPYLGWAIASWSVGVVLVGLGGYLLAIHGDPACECTGDSCADFNPETDCEEVFNTGASGGALLGLGVAATAGGFVLFSKKEPLHEVSLVPLHGGSMAQAGFRF